VSASREVGYVSECCMQPKKWAYRVSHFRSRSPFLAVSAEFFLRLPSPVHLRKRVHPLVRFVPLQSTSHPQSADDSKVTSAFLGVAVPHRDIHHPRKCSEHPIARRLSVLGVSHALDGFLRGWLCGFISPHCHVQGSLFRGFRLVRRRIIFR